MIRGSNVCGDSFVQNQCQIFGRYGDKVYQRKRNGEQRVYNYQYKPKYNATELSRRSDCIARTASIVSNPRFNGYSCIINKLYYYTPYFVHAGTFSFTCNTFLKLRSRGNYTLEINGVKFGMKLAPRSKIELCFEEDRTYRVICYKNGLIYSEREIEVLPEEESLESAYSEWFEEHLTELLALPSPQFSSLILYRRGIVPPEIYKTLSGKTSEGVLYESGKDRFSYVRSSYLHQHTSHGDHYYDSQRNVTECWKSIESDFKDAWKKYHQLWIKKEFTKTHKATKINNLWSRAIFRAAGETGIDAGELTPEKFIPGVEALGDLLDAAYMPNYGLSTDFLRVRIY